MTRGYPGDSPLSQAQIDAVLIGDGITPASQCKAKRKRALGKRGPKPEDVLHVPEAVLHVAVRKHMTALLGADAGEPSRAGVVWFSIAQESGQEAWQTNEKTGKKFSLRGQRNKAKGVRAGVPDIHICWRGGVGWIELKAWKNDTSIAQDKMHVALQMAGARVAVCWSVDEVERTLRGWGVPMVGRTAA
jgi:hypothetical protein